LSKLLNGEEKREELHEKITRAYERMRQRANNRKNKRKHGNVKWKPRVDDKVLVRTQPSSDAIARVTGKFIRPYEGPYVISKVISPSTVEVCDKNRKFRGQYNFEGNKAI
jgi:hypothetical protein